MMSSGVALGLRWSSSAARPLTSAAAKAVTDFPAAVRRLEEAFRKTPSSETLYQLGLLFDAQGKVAEAQDYMRRYLADPTTDANAPGRTEAERVMALPRPQAGEVQVLADQYGFVSVDGRLVGTLPFSVPLIVPVGQHVVQVEMRERRAGTSSITFVRSLYYIVKVMLALLVASLRRYPRLEAARR